MDTAVLDRYVGAFVDELARSGLRHVCLCPGARSTPLAILLRRHPDIRVWTHLDERSAAFFALGIAKALRQPAAVVSTSGTAAVNFAPAVAEAAYGHVPLLTLTADRPPELRDVGANQTLDQARLYGSHAKWSVELPPPDDSDDTLRYARTVGCRAVALAAAETPGPVHINLPFREPLLPTKTAQSVGVGSLAPYVTLSLSPRSPQPAMLAPLVAALREAERGLIVCGPQDDPQFPAAVAQLAQQLDYPVLADPLSQVRCGHHVNPLILDAYDSFLRDESLVGRLKPDLILRFGAAPTSKHLLLYLKSHRQARQILVLPGAWNDPALVATDAIDVDAPAFCRALLSAVRPWIAPPAAVEWSLRWQQVNAAARSALARRLSAESGLSEPAVFLQLAQILPTGTTIFVGNSMPVRDLDGFFPAMPRPLRFLANRGLSGIDGVVSTALGAAAVSSDPLVLVIGDLSFYHDMNGLLAAQRHGLSATIVLLNNDGGGIFSLLPQVEEEHFEELFAQPHGLDFRYAAEMYRLSYRRPADQSQLRQVLRQAIAAPGTHLIEIRTDRAANAALHRDIWREVAETLRGAPATGAKP